MQKTKKPTCVGFFVGPDLLTSWQVQQPWLVQQQERLEQQQERLEQAQLQELELELEPVQQQGLEQEPEFQLAFHRKQQETEPTEQQQERSDSFFFLHVKDVKNNQGT
jgi:hypothetical protein